jgi:hypothetical protein
MTDPVRIGVAVPDLSTFVAIDPAYGVGDQQEQMGAVLEGWRRRGALPEVAASLELSFRSFDVIDTDGKRAVADGFASDNVLAVVGARDFTYGAVRLAESHHVPVIDVNAVPTSLFRRTDPYLFTVRAAQDVLYRGFAEWAHGEGLFAGRMLGVFTDRFTRESAAEVTGLLATWGCHVSIQVDSDGAGVGSESDQSAAEHFRAKGVDAVLPFISGSSLMRFLAACDEIGYAPEIIDLETGEHTTDITAHLLPARLYHGTRALTMSRVGEVPAGMELHPCTAEAVDDFADHTGRRLDPGDPATSGELTNLLLVSDLVRLLLAGLQQAPSLTRDGVVSGLEQVTDLLLASGGNASFRPGEHWAIREAREVRWDGDAGCWVAVSDFAPLPAP